MTNIASPTKDLPVSIPGSAAIELNLIVAAVSEEMDVPVKAMMMQSWASGPEARARQVAMYLYWLAHPAKGYSRDLAVFFDREVSTVCHNVRRMKALMGNRKVARVVKNVQKRLK